MKRLYLLLGCLHALGISCSAKTAACIQGGYEPFGTTWDVPYSGHSYSSVLAGDAVGTRYGSGRLDSLEAWQTQDVRGHHWMQLDLGGQRDVDGVVTLGGPDNRWIRSFQLNVSVEGISWAQISAGAVFRGNSDSNTPVITRFPTPQRIQYVRILLVEFVNRPALRAGVLLLDNGPVTCYDVDECSDFTHDCSLGASCINTDASFTCSNCSGWYTDASPEGNCELDECAAQVHDCDVNAECIKTHGSFDCVCRHGLSGNGTSCEVSRCSSWDIEATNVSASPSAAIHRIIPSDFPDLDIWLKATDTEVGMRTDPFDGRLRVTNWQDRSPNHHVFSQQTLSLQPIFDENGFGPGRPSVKFEPPGQRWHGSHFLELPGFTGPQIGATVVARIKPLSDRGTIMSQGFNHGGNENGWLFHRGPDNWANNNVNTLAWAHHDGQTNANHAMWAPSPAGTSPANQEQIVAVRKNGRNVRLYVDGVQVYEENLRATNIRYRNNPPVWVGTAGDPYAYVRDNFDGHIGEIVMYQRALSDDEFSDVLEYFQEPGSCSDGVQNQGIDCGDTCIGQPCVRGNNCHRNATCADVPGGDFTCTCDAGFTGDGMTCSDVDECSSEVHDCDVNAACINLHSSFSCACNVGFSGDGTFCEPSRCTFFSSNASGSSANASGSLGGSAGDLSEIPDLDIWLKATEAEMLLEPDASDGRLRVTQWKDRSPNHHVFDQSETIRQPIFDENGFGPGRPSVKFEPWAKKLAGAQWLQLPGFTGPQIGATVVARIKPLSDRGTIMSQGFNHGGNENGWLFHRGPDNWANNNVNTLAWAHHDGQTNANHAMWAPSPAGTSPANQEQIVAVRKNGRNVRLYVDGVQVYEENLRATNIRYRNNPPVWVGTAGDHYARDNFDGHIGEIVMYQRALSDDEFSDVLEYFQEPGSCSDGVQNQGEEGIDCGDTCIGQPCVRGNNCHRNATCADVPGGDFTCTCDAGFTGDGVMCMDVDECLSSASNTCDINAVCANTLGSFTCSCKPGWIDWSPRQMGTSCDEDECSIGSHNCSMNAVCLDLERGFACHCNSGFADWSSGEMARGTNCDEDECSAGTSNCAPEAACSDTEAGFECTCNTGFVGDGMACSDVNECTLESIACHANATCVNSRGSFDCTCNLGFAGPGTHCSSIPAPSETVLILAPVTSISIASVKPVSHYCETQQRVMKDCVECSSCASADALVDGNHETRWNPVPDSAQVLNNGTQWLLSSNSTDKELFEVVFRTGIDERVFGALWSTWGDGDHDWPTVAVYESWDGVNFAFVMNAGLPQGTSGSVVPQIAQLRFPVPVAAPFLRLTHESGSRRPPNVREVTFLRSLTSNCECETDSAWNCTSEWCSCTVGDAPGCGARAVPSTSSPSPSSSSAIIVSTSSSAIMMSTSLQHSISTSPLPLVAITTPEGAETPLHLSNETLCFEEQVAVAPECQIEPLTIRCRAWSQAQFDVFVVEGRSAFADDESEFPLVNVVGSCVNFFAWTCGRLGLEPRSSLQCDTACSFIDQAVRKSFAGGCENLFCSLTSAAHATCRADIEYAVWSSCDFQGDAIGHELEDAIADFLAPYTNESDTCYGPQAQVEVAAFTKVGATPVNLGVVVNEHPLCHEGYECRFACWNSNWSVSRTHDRLRIDFDYVGPCACPELDYAMVDYNIIGPPGDNTFPLAARLAGSHLGESFNATLFPLFSSNSVLVEARFGRDACLFLYSLRSGGFLGLPDGDGLLSTGVSSVDFIGFNPELSSQDFEADVRRRTALLRGAGSNLAQESEASLLRKGGKLRQLGAPRTRAMAHRAETVLDAVSLASNQPSADAILSLLGTSCPQDQGSCVYVCVSAGFRTEAYGAYVLFLTIYAGGECDCGDVFKLPASRIDEAKAREIGPVLIGSFRGQGSSAYVSLENVEMLPANAQAQNQSWLLGATARRDENDNLLVDIGPGLCAYSFEVSGGFILGAGPVDPASSQGNFSRDGGGSTVGGGSQQGSSGSGDGSSISVENTGVDGGQAQAGGKEAMSEWQGARAADAVEVGVVSAVLVSVVVSVISSAKAALAAQVAAAATGTASVGWAALSVLLQAQFLAIAGRIGSDGQPESTRTMFDGLNFLNFHIIDFFGDDGAPHRRAEGMPPRKKPLQDTSDSARESLSNCEQARASDRELGGTITSSVVGLVATFFARSALQHLIWFFQGRMNMEKGDHVAPFPSWELAVYITQFLGLADSAGEAIASGCPQYEVAGGFVLVFLLTTLSWLGLLVFYGIRTGKTIWEEITLSDAWTNFKTGLQDAKNHEGFYEKLTGVDEAFMALWIRGEWAQEEDNHEVHGRFVEKYGALYAGCHGPGWFYPFWAMFKHILLGICLSAVLRPEQNAVAILILVVIDLVLLIVFHPDGEFRELFKNIYATAMDIAICATIVAYLQGQIPALEFEGWFRILSVASIVPGIFAVLVSAVISFVQSGVEAGSCCIPHSGKDAFTVSGGDLVTAHFTTDTALVMKDELTKERITQNSSKGMLAPAQAHGERRGFFRPSTSREPKVTSQDLHSNSETSQKPSSDGNFRVLTSASHNVHSATYSLHGQTSTNGYAHDKTPNSRDFVSGSAPPVGAMATPGPGNQRQEMVAASMRQEEEEELRKWLELEQHYKGKLAEEKAMLEREDQARGAARREQQAPTQRRLPNNVSGTGNFGLPAGSSAREEGNIVTVNTDAQAPTPSRSAKSAFEAVVDKANGQQANGANPWCQAGKSQRKVKPVAKATAAGPAASKQAQQSTRISFSDMLKASATQQAASPFGSAPASTKKPRLPSGIAGARAKGQEQRPGREAHASSQPVRGNGPQQYLGPGVFYM